MGEIFLKEGAIECTRKIEECVEMLAQTAHDITGEMEKLKELWGGAGADHAQAIYEEEYKQRLSVQIPDMVQDFRKFLDACMEELKDLDARLAGKA